MMFAVFRGIKIKSSLKFKSLFLALSIAFIQAMPNIVFAAKACSKLFLISNAIETISIDANQIEPNFNLEKGISTKTHDGPLSNYSKLERKVNKQVNNLNSDDQLKIREIIDALYFFDYEHIGQDFVATFLNPKRDFRSIDLSDKYNLTNDSANKSILNSFFDIFFKRDRIENQPNNPFVNFQKTNAFIKYTKPTINIETLRLIHSSMMRNLVDKGKMVEGGAIRGRDEYGNITNEMLAISEREKDIINSNPYLRFFITSQTKNRNYLGQIFYFSVEHPTSEVIERAKTFDSKLAIKWQNYLKNKDTIDSSERPEFYKSIIEVLIAERLSFYESERARLDSESLKSNRDDFGKLDFEVSSEYAQRIIELIADLQADLIAIHPFEDGNGRTIRAFTNLILIKEGLPPAIIMNPWLDIQVNKTEWRKILISGVNASYNLLKDLSHRIEHGLSIKNSPYLLYPYLYSFAQINLKNQNGKKEIKDYRNATIDPAQFSSFFKAKIEQNPNLLAAIKNNTLKEMSKLVEEFITFFQSKTVDYMHSKDGLQEIAIKFIDPDFIDKFGIIVANEQKLWEGKINRHYNSRQLIWRGLSQMNYEFSDLDLVNHFKYFQPHLMSNRVTAFQKKSQENIRSQIIYDFESYNKQLLSGNYISMVNDHATMGPKYGISYGLSTSKREAIAKAFAMGAMVIAPLGQHNKPELQEKLKSRINIGVFKADKDIDLNRLHQIEKSFLNPYPRQAEVMAIGGVDPDVVVNIQRIGSNGKVMHTFARDLENPSKVYMIKGRWVQGEEPLPTNRILNTWSLF